MDRTELDRDWREVGRQAFLAGEHSAPILNATVHAAISGHAPTQPARIFREFSAGWHAANLAAEVPE